VSYLLPCRTSYLRSSCPGCAHKRLPTVSGPDKLEVPNWRKLSTQGNSRLRSPSKNEMVTKMVTNTGPWAAIEQHETARVAEFPIHIKAYRDRTKRDGTVTNTFRVRCFQPLSHLSGRATRHKWLRCLFGRSPGIWQLAGGGNPRSCRRMPDLVPENVRRFCLHDCTVTC
jgi:hypothetical protein